MKISPTVTEGCNRSISATTPSQKLRFTLNTTGAMMRRITDFTGTDAGRQRRFGMDYIRKADARGHAHFGWLDSHHSFSFGSYYDPRHMGISTLRVINDDTVKGGTGFGVHGHRDMEIISYVLEGAIEHRDSGNHFTLPVGEVQRMSAGAGIQHSEFNASKTDPLHFLQIWIIPDVTGIEPGYEQKRVEQRGPLTPLVTPDGRDGSLSIHQDASLYRLRLQPGDSFTLQTGNGRAGYLHIVEGSARAGETGLAAGDGVGFIGTREQAIEAGERGLEALWFDLPPEH